MHTHTFKLTRTSLHSHIRELIARMQGEAIFVWSVWAGMLLFALASIFVYGRNFAIAEDWHMIGALTGNESDILDWLWMQNNEHRIPLPKLIILILLKLTHGDFRSGMFFNVISLGILTAIIIRCCYYLRGGKTSFTDAFFPIALLHMGNWENLFWSWQVGFVLPTIITCLLILIIVSYTSLLKPRTAIAAGICLLLLPLCGANGLIYIGPVIPWLTYEAYLHYRNSLPGARRGIGIFLFCAVILTIAVAVIYFIGYQRPSWNPPSPGIKDTILTSGKFLALGMGPVVAQFWVLSIGGAVVLMVATGILLLYTLFHFTGAELRRAIGLFFLFGGSVVFALAMGWGRAGLVPTVGLPMRYVLLAVPFYLICYFSWQLYGSAFLRNIVQWSLFLVIFIFILPNAHLGYYWRNWYIDGTNAVNHDIKQGIPHSILAERHRAFLLHWDQWKLYTGMQMLKHAGMGPFKDMKEDNTSAVPTNKE